MIPRVRRLLSGINQAMSAIKVFGATPRGVRLIIVASPAY